MSEDKYKAYNPDTFVKGPKTLEWEQGRKKEAHPALTWCFENKDAIQALHSSNTFNGIFTHECDCCNIIYKPCMFSYNQRKDYLGAGRMCKWCQAECAHVSDEYSFDIHHHVHCNRPGKKICGTYPSLTLEPPPAPEKKFKKEASISDIAAPEVQFTIKKKMMTQGQRRKAEAEARRQKEEQEGSTLESAAK